VKLLNKALYLKKVKTISQKTIEGLQPKPF